MFNRKFLTRVVALLIVTGIICSFVPASLTVNAAENNEPVCGIDDEGHVHTEDCYLAQEEQGGEANETDDSFLQECEDTQSTENSDVGESENEEVNGIEEMEDLKAVVESCFDENGNLICKIPEHIHISECYNDSGELTCDLDEHTHTSLLPEEATESETDNTPEIVADRLTDSDMTVLKSFVGSDGLEVSVRLERDAFDGYDDVSIDDVSLTASVLTGDKRDKAGEELNAANIEYEDYIALDISLIAPNGEVLEPEEGATIESLKVPAAEQSIPTNATVELMHHEASPEGTIISVETLASTGMGFENIEISAEEGTKVQKNAAEIIVKDVQVESFSTFTITWLLSDVDTDSVSSVTSLVSEIVWIVGSTEYKANVHYVDADSRKEIVTSKELSANANATLTLEDEGNTDGYGVFVDFIKDNIVYKLDSYSSYIEWSKRGHRQSTHTDGSTPLTSISYNNNFGWCYKTLGWENNFTGDSGATTVVDLYLVYNSDSSGIKTARLHFVDENGNALSEEQELTLGVESTVVSGSDSTGQFSAYRQISIQSVDGDGNSATEQATLNYQKSYIYRNNDVDNEYSEEKAVGTDGAAGYGESDEYENLYTDGRITGIRDINYSSGSESGWHYRYYEDKADGAGMWIANTAAHWNGSKNCALWFPDGSLDVSTVDVYLVYDTAVEPVPYSVDGAPGVTITMYDIKENTEITTDNGHNLLFAGSDNGWTGSDGGVSQGLVSSGSELVETLDSNPDITRFENVGGLFQQDPSTGYYYYDSSVNFATLVNGQDGYELQLYDTPHGFTTNSSDTVASLLAQFLPFNRLNNNVTTAVNSYSKYDFSYYDLAETDYGTDYVGKDPNYNDYENDYWFNNGADYWFGMEIDFEFYLPKDGMAGDENMFFSFSGDDDVWVFISDEDGSNETLVLDMGGVHDSNSGKIDFRTGEVTICNTATGNENSGEQLSLNQITQYKFDTMEEWLEHYGGKTYHLTMVYFERGAGGSNCQMEFNLMLEPTTLDIPVTKEIVSDCDIPENAELEAFTFTLKEYDSGKQIDEVSINAADILNNSIDTVYFEKLNYDDEGTYTYIVEETADNSAGWKYDSTKYKVTVEVTESNNKLTAIPTYEKIDENGNSTVEDNIKFVNEYAPEEATADITITKTVEGQPLPDGYSRDFAFVLTGAEDKDKETVSVSEIAISVPNNDTTNAFTLSFAKPGVYTYTAAEITVSDDNWTCDTAEHTLVIEVIDNNGILEIKSAALDGKAFDIVSDSIEFTNTYTPIGQSAEVTIEKIVEGQLLPDGYTKDFTFKITGTDIENEKTVTITNSGENNFTLDFTKAGEYAYTVIESAADDDNWTCDTAEHILTVSVIDNSGALEIHSATLDGKAFDVQSDRITFTNTYSPIPTSVTIPAEKILTGQIAPKVETFTFYLKDSTDDNSEPVDFITIDGEGRNAFTLEFTEAGNYEYYITEKQDTAAGWTYDDVVYKVDVAVTDDGGTLTAKTDYSKDGSPINAIKFVNDYETAPVTLTIPIKKVVTGKAAPNAESFEFALENTVTGEKQTVTIDNAAIGNTGESEFTVEYTEAGTYYYTVAEKIGITPGWSYDGTDYTVKVEVKDIGGQLIVESTEIGKVSAQTASSQSTDSDTDASETEITFVNSYNPDEVTFSIPVKKTISDIDSTAEPFTFSLLDSNGDEIENITINEVNGTALAGFSGITYDEAGKYTYTVKEVKGNATGWTYDESAFDVTITVEDVNGALKATAEYKKNDEDTDSIVFENTYKPNETEFAIPVAKRIIGQNAPEKTFTFILTDENGKQINTANIVGEGSTRFSAIPYTAAGDYVYYITEQQENSTGWTYSTGKYKVVVTVTDDKGNLKASITDIEEITQFLPYTEYPDELTAASLESTITFTNKYSPLSTEIEIPVTKIITGQTAPDVEVFNFVLTGENDYKQVITTTTAGTIEFGKITYTETGTYTYTVTETDNKTAGWTYDETEYKVIVNVSDENGQLEADIVYTKDGNEIDSIIFKNHYEPKPATISIPVEKVTSGQSAPEDETFNFVLADETGNEKYTAITNAGTADFEEISFDEAGTYEYTVTEVKGKTAGWTYDETVYTVTVELTDIGGVLNADVSYTVDSESADSIKFTNSYKPKSVAVSIPVRKTITGLNSTNEVFSFVLADEESNVIDSIEITGTGTESFTDIVYTETGEYTYTVTEKKGSNTNWTYDETIYTVTVNVADIDGKLEATVSYKKDGNLVEDGIVFTNTYSVPTPIISDVPSTSVIDSNTEPEIDTEPETETVPEPEVEPTPEPEPEPEPEAKPETEPEINPEPEKEPEESVNNDSDTNSPQSNDSDDSKDSASQSNTQTVGNETSADIDLSDDGIPLDGATADEKTDTSKADDDIITSDEGTPANTIPKTGDSSIVWIAMLLASGVGLAILILTGRSKKHTR